MYDVAARLAVLGLRGSTSGRVEVAERSDGGVYRLVVSGQGRERSVEGSATLTLSPRGDGTVVRYRGSVTVRGKAARLGRFALGAAAKLLVRQFFEGMDRELRKRPG